MSFTLQKATRTGMKALCGFYGKSGSGKTMSALLFARGLVGPSGKITLIDTENKRGSIFADLIPGGYDVVDFDAPFSPDRYSEAIEFAESKSDCIVIDSMTHEWSGEGGVLDWADSELEKFGGGDNNKMRSWIKPKMAHKAMVSRLLRSPRHIICCLRGEEKTHASKKSDGRATVITDDFSTPIFDSRFIFEMLVNFETINREGKGGFVYVMKTTHPSIGPLLPTENEQVGVKHGEALSKWCAAPSVPGVPQTPAVASTDGLATAKTREWFLGELAPYGESLLKTYFEQTGILDPSQNLVDIALKHVPINKASLREVMQKIETFKNTGNI